MPRFLQAHATHPDAHMALALAAAQLDAQRGAMQPTLGWLYLAEAYVPQAQALLAEAKQRWPGCAFVGASALAVCASGVEYFDEPALVLMLSDLPTEQWRIFSGRQPLYTGRPTACCCMPTAAPPTCKSCFAKPLPNATAAT